MRIREIRQSLGYTQKQACDCIGCSRTVYTRYETGSRQPSLSMLIRMSEVFGVTLDYLVGHGNQGQLTLSSREREMVYAFRSADHRAQMDAFDLLRSHGDRLAETG